MNGAIAAELEADRTVGELLCSLCGLPAERLTRVGRRCGRCSGSTDGTGGGGGAQLRDNARMRAAIVHPTLPFELDPGARAFVLHHQGGATLEEVATAIGVTRERLLQIEAKAFEKIRRYARVHRVDVAALLAALRDRSEDERHPDAAEDRLVRVVAPPADDVEDEDREPAVEPLSLEGLLLDGATRALAIAAEKLAAVLGIEIEGFEEVGMTQAPRMITHEGRTQSIADWASEIGIAKEALRSRLAKVSIAEAIAMGTNPPKGGAAQRARRERGHAPGAPDLTRTKTRASRRPPPTAETPAQAVRAHLTALDPIELLRSLGYAVDELGIAPSGDRLFRLRREAA